MKNKMSVQVSHIAFLELSLFSTGQKVRKQKMMAGNMAHFINGIRRPFGFSLLSLKDAIKGSKIASTNRPDAAITDRIFNTPNNINCGISGLKPALLGGR